MLDATVLGLYEDWVLTVEQNGKYKNRAQGYQVATGASKDFPLSRTMTCRASMGPGSTDPMNVYGVLPGESVFMVGAGNIGLIVSYQLLQAGLKSRSNMQESQVRRLRSTRLKLENGSTHNAAAPRYICPR